MLFSFLSENSKYRKGFTLIELILVLAIFALLTTASISNLSAYRNKQVLNGETSQVLSMLSQARSQTLDSKSQLSYGVRINTDRVILFPTSFASSTSGNEEYVLHHSVAITNTSLTGGSLDVLFQRLTGETSNYGTIRVSLISDPNQYHIISINQTGFVGLQN